jgi:5-methylcytosine-specific restriction enzyme subunit McrC
LLEVFISAFFDAVTEIVRGGLMRQYREREEDLQVVRGRILASRHFATHANRPDRIACRFDDLTADNFWNRLIKAGLRAVRPWLTSVELNRRWTELMAVFEEVTDIAVGSKTPSRLVFDRHAVRYRTAIEWVRWILALLSPSLRAGEDAAPGLLFDMNQLFQSAVAAVLQRRGSVEPDTIVEAQDTSQQLAQVEGTDGRRAFRLKPDLVVRRHGRILAIGDTKWKRLKVSRSGYLMPSEADMYQMLAYAAAYRCEHLALIYPTHAGLLGAKETTFKLPASGKQRPVVSVICLDVHSDSLLPSCSAVESPFFRLLSGERFLLAQ